MSEDDNGRGVSQRLVQGFRRLDAWRQIALGGVAGLVVVAGGRWSIFTIRELAIPISGSAVIFTELLSLRADWENSPDSSAELLENLAGLKLFTAAAAVAVVAATAYTQTVGDSVPTIAAYSAGIPIAGAVVLSRRTKPLFFEILNLLYRLAEGVSETTKSNLRDSCYVIFDKIGWFYE